MLELGSSITHRRHAVWTDLAILGGWTSAKSASCGLHLGELAALKPTPLVEQSGHPGEAHPSRAVSFRPV